MKKLCFVLFLASCLPGLASAGDMIGAAGAVFLNSAGEKTDVAPSSKIIGFYFSAHWCPPCKTFTPKLVEFYSGLKQDGSNFEIIFVSSDKSEAEMMQYMQEAGMPWLAVPYRSKEAGALQQIKQTELDSKGIPALVVVRDGQIITKAGRRDVEQMSKGAYQKWLTMSPETVGETVGNKASVRPPEKNKVRMDELEPSPIDTNKTSARTIASRPPPPEKNEMRMDELKAQLVELDGKVIKTVINYVSSFTQVTKKRYSAHCGFVGGGSELVLIPEDGKEIFQELAKKGFGASRTTICLWVHNKRLEAVGTHYNKDKEEYGW